MEATHQIFMSGIILGAALMFIADIIRVAIVGRHTPMSDKERQEYLDLLSSEGIKAHLYLPGAEYRDKPAVAEALDRLNYQGCVFTDLHGLPIGGVACMNSTSEEIAQIRRSSFKVVD